MARGGSRDGQPGNLYPNRSDMRQPVRTKTGQEYGQAQAQADAQGQIPLPQGGQLPPALGPAPGEIPSLMGPSNYPDEPLTAGLASGAGPGPDALMSSPMPNKELGILRGIYGRFPSEDLRRLLEWTENNIQ